MPNPVAERNSRRLRLLLHRQTSTPIVLVLGGGVVGNGLAELYSDPSMGLIGLDIYATPLTQVVADGHQIPLADESVDAVVVQAVLQSTLDPGAVADEIHRVLRADGLVYAETGFMQQVCEGPYDFYRFTERGQRYLFRRFSQLDSGVVAGPGTQVVWTLDYLARGLFRSRASGRVVRGLFSWLRHLDSLIPYAYRVDNASCVYFLGRKQPVEAQIQDLLDGYQGALKPSDITS
jgi:hypothetical protein